MTPSPAPTPRTWLRATWTGWLLGVPAIIGLALIGEALGIGASQGLVGAGMGLAVGGMQSRVLGAMVPKRGGWILATTVGLALPFLVHDISRLLGRELPYSLPVMVALGGLVAGAGQALLLRPRYRRALAWVAASIVGWSLAAGTTAIADTMFQARSIRGIGGALAYLGVILAGGLVLALATGPCLTWIGREEGGQQQ